MGQGYAYEPCRAVPADLLWYLGMCLGVVDVYNRLNASVNEPASSARTGSALGRIGR